MRKRTSRQSSCGSMWTSLAPSSAAWKIIELTSRTSGASETPSSSLEVVLAPRRPRARRSRRVARASAPRRSRAKRWSSVRMSSRAATASSTLSRVASRSSSIAAMSAGIGDRDSGARCLERDTAAPRRARARSSGSARPPPARRSGRGCRRTAGGSARRRARATPSPDASPSSTSACASEPRPARPRAAASRSAGTSPVGSSRSATSSASSFTCVPVAGEPGGRSGCRRRLLGRACACGRLARVSVGRARLAHVPRTRYRLGLVIPEDRAVAVS